MNCYFSKFSVFLLLFTHFSFAQVNQNTENVLTLEKALEICIKNNIKIKKQQNQLELAKTSNRSAYLSFLPYIGISGNASSSDGRQFDQTKGAVTNISVNRANINFNVSMDLIDFIKRIYLTSQSRNYLNSQIELDKRNKEDSKFEVVKNYLQIILDQKLIEIGIENYNQQYKLLEQIREFKRLGLKSEVDIFIQESELSKSEIVLLQYRNQLLNDKLSLSEVLQISTTFEVEEPKWGFPDSTKFSNSSLEEYLNVGLRNRSDLKSLNYIESANKSALKSRYSVFTPNLSLFYNYGSNYSSLLVPRTFADQIIRDNNYGVIGLSINIPLLNGFRNSVTIANSKLNYENSLLDKQVLSLKIKNDISRAHNDVESSFKIYKASQQDLKSVSTAFDIQKNKYELGQISLIELNQTNSNFVKSKANASQAYFNLIFQNYFFNYFVGE